MFWYSFKILPDRLKLIRLYPCGSLGQSISFVFGARVGHFAATPQSDVVGIWSSDLGVMATPSVRQKMPFIRAFITLRSQFHLHHRSQRALTEIVSKITPNLGLVLLGADFCGEWSDNWVGGGGGGGGASGHFSTNIWMTEVFVSAFCTTSLCSVSKVLCGPVAAGELPAQLHPGGTARLCTLLWGQTAANFPQWTP